MKRLPVGILVLCACLGLLATLGARVLFAGVEADPALWARDPSRFRGDAWDRRAASHVLLIRRPRAVCWMHGLLPDHHEPSPEDHGR